MEEANGEQDCGDKDEMDVDIKEIKSDYFTNLPHMALSLSSVKVFFL